MSAMSPAQRFALAILRVFAPLFAIFVVVPLALAENPAPAGAALHGMAPLPEDRRVPHNLLPPGSLDMDSGPSDVIFPQQQVTIRFNHAKHLGEDIGTTCKTCHAGAYRSTNANDALVPSGELCDACHSTDHSDPAHVKAGDEAMGQCSFCHIGYKASDGNTVVALALPRANLLFNHKAHSDRNIACTQCHGVDRPARARDARPAPAHARVLQLPPAPRLGLARRREERLRDVPHPR